MHVVVHQVNSTVINLSSLFPLLKAEPQPGQVVSPIAVLRTYVRKYVVPIVGSRLMFLAKIEFYCPYLSLSLTKSPDWAAMSLLSIAAYSFPCTLMHPTLVIGSCNIYILALSVYVRCGLGL